MIVPQDSTHGSDEKSQQSSLANEGLKTTPDSKTDILSKRVTYALDSLKNKSSAPQGPAEKLKLGSDSERYGDMRMS